MLKMSVSKWTLEAVAAGINNNYKNRKKWHNAIGVEGTSTMETGTQAARDGTKGITVQRNALWRAKTT